MSWRVTGHRELRWLCCVLFVGVVLCACSAGAARPPDTPEALPTVAATRTPKATFTPLPTMAPTWTKAPTPTAVATYTPWPTYTPLPTYTLLPTHTPWPTYTLLPNRAPAANAEPGTPAPALDSVVEEAALPPTLEPLALASPTLALPTLTLPPAVVGDCPYVGNKSSLVFHRADCSSVKQMSDKNKVCFSSRDAALAAGYKPCGRCKP